MNNIFSMYLNRLGLVYRPLLRNIFSGAHCEVVQTDGRRRMKAVVLDSTAVGILGEVPKYIRHYETLRKSMMDTKCMYVVPLPETRKVLETICRMGRNRSRQHIIWYGTESFDRDKIRVLVIYFTQSYPPQTGTQALVHDVWRCYYRNKAHSSTSTESR